MLVPISWLKDYVDIRVSPETLAKKLDAFAQDGGTVVCTGEAGLWDGDFERHDTPLLNCTQERLSL